MSATSTLVRMVNRTHVVEEARHVSFGRDEVASTYPSLDPASQAVHALLTAVVSAAVVSVLVNKKVYADVGLDPKEAARQALGAKVMGFLAEQGMVPWFTKPIYKFVHLI